MLNVWSVPKASLLPAVILGSLVLFTYSTLQNYGPESTLRKFHSAVHNIYQTQLNSKGKGNTVSKSDWSVLQSTLEEDIGSLDNANEPANPQAIALIDSVIAQFQMGKAYSLARMDRRPREVHIVVQYIKDPVPTIQTVWVIDKPLGGRAWKISARKTLSALTEP